MSPVTLEPRVMVNGREWSLFSFEFTTVNGTFQSYIYAISFEPASYIIEEMKETARLFGCVEGTIKQ